MLFACTGTEVDSAAETLDSDPQADPSCVLGEQSCDERGVCWVSFCADAYRMGSAGAGEELEQPAHAVTLRGFELTISEMTAEQHRACVDDGSCRLWPGDEPAVGRCNQEEPEAGLPANCIDWDMAVELCAWAGGRLPSESEWEYAARSGGQPPPFPWGWAPPSCTRANFTQGDCGQVTEPVCSLPDGDTEQGLCDVGGNVFEWVEDWMHDGYVGAPDDGSAWVDGSDESYRVMRGGGIGSAEDLRTRNRTFHGPEFHYGGLGVRCAR